MSKTAKSKRIIQSGDATDPATDSKTRADQLLSEIGRLYRERFRALYNKDIPALKTINEQIDFLRTKLSRI
jgi:hypothetical protein